MGWRPIWPRYVDLARRHGLRVIEDCAQCAWRGSAMAGGSAVWRHRRVQLLSDQESRARIGDGGAVSDGRCGACGAAPGAARIWLARALCQRLRRHEHAARRAAGGDPARRSCAGSMPTMRAARRSPAPMTRGSPARGLACPARRGGAHARLSPICRAHAAARCGASGPEGARHRHEHPLSDAGASPARLSRAAWRWARAG